MSKSELVYGYFKPHLVLFGCYLTKFIAFYRQEIFNLTLTDKMDKNLTELEQKCINTIRFLAVDAVEKAKSGHPGTPLGAATMAFTLWDRFLKHNPANPKWIDRDRFVLSCGHASMLLYGLLHLNGYDLSIDEIKNFRQWESKTAGHPEYGLTPGVETTTGPLGQGFANAVGMALAERWMAANFNQPKHKIVDHYTYALVSDGDLMEGVAYEAASFAGHQQLNKLIALYDSNDITIEGELDLSFSEDIKKRFEGCGWQVIGPVDGFDIKEVEQAIKKARTSKSKPTLIHCKTIIGYGSPVQAQAKSHGEPLGEENAKVTKKALNWPEDERFYIPEGLYDYTKKILAKGVKAEDKWNTAFEAYKAAHPDLADQFIRQNAGELPEGWDKDLDELFTAPEDAPTRGASGVILNALVKNGCTLVGGSADLGPSNKTALKDKPDLNVEHPGGSNIHYGIREHAMGSISNGIALHGGLIPYTGTFLTFSDYMRPPIRLAAMMGLHVIYVFSHDSIGLGEDGPTHQPIEQLMNLRGVPNLSVIRPADSAETVEAWKSALQNNAGPTAILLSRQKVIQMNRQICAMPQLAAMGGYILWENDPDADAICVGTGSEVSLAMNAAERLANEGWRVRVVSLPSWEIFDAQPQEYREKVLPPKVKNRVAVEAGLTQGWEKYIGLEGAVVGMTSFGASAPSSVLYEKFGITADAVYVKMKELLQR